MTDQFATTPPPPYYAVIFTSQRDDEDKGYTEMARTMIELALTIPGYLGIETVNNETGHGISVSYWKDEKSIRTWRRHSEHRIAQDWGKSDWYKHYEVRVAKVERAYSGPINTD